MVESMAKAAKSQRADAIANRERIIKAAREVVAVRGLDAEIREIAEAAGVGVGTLYRHFESRDRLLAAVLLKSKEDMQSRFEAAVNIAEPRAALTATIRAVAEGCGESGALSGAVLDDRAHEDESGEAEFTERLTNLLRRGTREGAFRADLDVWLAVATLKSVFSSGALLALPDQRSTLQAADAFSDLFLRAIEAPPGPQTE